MRTLYYSALIAVLAALTGCGDAPNAPASEKPAPSAAAEPAIRTPKEVAQALFDAGNKGEKESFLSLMTEKAAAALDGDESGAFDLEPGQFTSYEVGTETIDGPEALVPINAVQAETNEALNMTLKLRLESGAWRVYGVKLALAQGMEADLDFETLSGLAEQMAGAIGQGLQDSFENAFGPASEEMLAQAKARYDALAPMDAAAFDASWQNAVDYSGKKAGEVIASLAEAMGLTLDVNSQEASLDPVVEESLTAIGFAKAMERACLVAGVYPDYEESGMTGMWQSMTAPVAEAIGALVKPADGSAPAEDALAPEDKTAPKQPLVRLQSGARPYPALCTGPFLVSIDSLEENTPYGTGQIGITVYAFKLPGAVAATLQDATEPVAFTALHDPEGNPLADLDMQFMGGGTMDGAMYVDYFIIELRNLLRSVETIGQVSGSVTAEIPTAVEELIFDNLVAGEAKTAGDVRMTATTVGESTEFEIRGPAEITENLKATFLPFDTEGNQIDTIYSSVFSWNAGQAQASLNTAEVPATVRVKLITAVQRKQYEFDIRNVPLAKYAQQPESIQPLVFEGDVPVDVTFKEFSDKSDPNFVEITLLLDNRSNKAITAVFTTLHYFNDNGDELDDFPSSFSGFPGEPLVEPGAQAEQQTTAFSMPPETATIRAEVNTIGFIDGTNWYKED